MKKTIQNKNCGGNDQHQPIDGKPNAEHKCMEFAPEVVMSVYSGVMLARGFGDVHDCINHVFGAPLPTMLLPKKEVVGSCQNRIRNQVPRIAEASDVLAKHQNVNAANLNKITSELHSILGARIPLTRGCGEPDGWEPKK